MLFSQTEHDRIYAVIKRDGMLESGYWARRVYLIYRGCLLKKRSRLPVGQKPSHLTLDLFRSHAVRSCLQLRQHIRSLGWEIPVR